MSDPTLSIEQQRWMHQLAREDAHRVHDKAMEFTYRVNDAAIAGGNLALKMAVLISGGAVISLLTFIGSLPMGQRAALTAALVWFATGVGMGGFGFLFAYLTNYLTAAQAGSRIPKWDHPYLDDGPKTHLFGILKKYFHVAALTVGTASLLVFVVGVFCVRSALVHLQP